MGTPEGFNWIVVNKRNERERNSGDILINNMSSYFQYRFNQYKSEKKLELFTSGGFLLRVKLLHVVDIYITNSVCCVEHHVLVSFGQFCYLLLEFRLSNANEKKKDFKKKGFDTNTLYSLFGTISFQLKRTEKKRQTTRNTTLLSPIWWLSFNTSLHRDVKNSIRLQSSPKICDMYCHIIQKEQDNQSQKAFTYKSKYVSHCW